MTTWRLVEGVLIVAVVLLGGTAAGLGAACLLTRIARRYGTDDVPLPKPVAKFGKLRPLEADAMRARATDRRDRAGSRHAEGHAIDSGDAETRHFKLVRR